MKHALRVSLIIMLSFGWCVEKISAQDSASVDYANLLLTYMMEYKQDSTNLEHARGEEMLLFVGNHSTLFMGYNSAKNDTLLKVAVDKGRQGVDAQTVTDFVAASVSRTPHKYKIYKNTRKNKIIYQDFNLDGQFYYEEPMNTLQWKIVPNSEKKFLSYTVQKAVTYYGGRTWEAWFTPEIPISDGPYKFHGLPGLIVKLQDTMKHYSFTLTSSERVIGERPIEVIIPDRVIRTDRAGFLKAQQNFRNSFIIHAQNAQLSNESQRVASENMRRRNNPIELKAD
jgi:GLPGLI family protein